MRFLIIGASGLIGAHLLRAAEQAGHVVTGTYRRFSLPGLVPFDTADLNAARELISAYRPEAVVHAAGWTWVDGCENDPQRAILENAQQPAQLARICFQKKIHFTYFSSSYVFDGTNGPYQEEDAPNPINAYGRSKWEGERLVQTVSEGAALIPRVVAVFGAEAQKKNFVYQVWRAYKTGAVLQVPADQISNPTFAADIARWWLALVERKACGIWHMASPLVDWTRKRWAEEFLEALAELGIRGHEAFRIESVPTTHMTQKALRPLNAAMLVRKLVNLNLPATEFRRAVARMIYQDSLLCSDLGTANPI